MRRLAAKADVFTTNLLPKRLAKFGLDPDTLMKGNPGLVYGSLSGWGLRGPDVDKLAFDTTAFFARGGINGALGACTHFCFVCVCVCVCVCVYVIRVTGFTRP